MSDAIRRALERANDFIAVHGGELERRAAARLCGGARYPELEVWLAGRSAGAEAGAGLEAWRWELSILGDLGIGSGPGVERLCEQLAGLQHPDGYWGCGDEAIPETGMLVGCLARTVCARTRVLDLAADWLAARFEPGLVQGFAWPAVAAYANAFANLAHDDADLILQWCGRELERGFRARRFAALQTARVLAWCDAGALPGARLAVAELREGVVAEQLADGSWAGPPSARVARAWDGLVWLTRLS